METSKKWLTTIEITQIPNLDGNDTLSWYLILLWIILFMV